jgi:hypothetical protein
MAAAWRLPCFRTAERVFLRTWAGTAPAGPDGPVAAASGDRAAPERVASRGDRRRARSAQAGIDIVALE